jgi:hypothetical protein
MHIWFWPTLNNCLTKRGAGHYRLRQWINSRVEPSNRKGTCFVHLDMTLEWIACTILIPPVTSTVYRAATFPRLHCSFVSWSRQALVIWCQTSLPFPAWKQCESTRLAGGRVFSMVYSASNGGLLILGMQGAIQAWPCGSSSDTGRTGNIGQTLLLGHQVRQGQTWRGLASDHRPPLYTQLYNPLWISRSASFCCMWTGQGGQPGCTTSKWTIVL